MSVNKKNRGIKFTKKQILHNTNLSVLLIVGLIILVLFAASRFRDNNNVEANNNVASNGSEESGQDLEMGNSLKEQELQFPNVLDEGRLEVESVFSFSGINPDADNVEASEIAAIEIKNISDTYMKTATIKAVFSDESQQTFVINDLPAGKTVIAFSVENLELPKDAVCIEMKADTVFEDIKNPESVSAAIDGTTVTIKNISEEELTNIDVYCRDVFNEKYFGGMTYKYSIEKLSIGESATITVSDSIMGVIDVVRMEINE